MSDRDPHEWRYVGRAGRRPPNAFLAWLAFVVSSLARGLAMMVRWLGAASLRIAVRSARLVLGEGKGHRIGPVEALVWLTVAAVAGAFLLLLSQHSLPLAVGLGALGIIWALRELR